MNVLEKSSHPTHLKLFDMLCSLTSVQSFKIEMTAVLFC